MTNNTKKTLKIYWEHTKNNRLLLFIVIFSIISSAVVSVIIPLYYKNFFDLLSGDEERTLIYSSLIKTLYFIAALEATKWVLGRISVFLNTRFQTTISTNLAFTSFKYLHKHSFSYFNNNFVGGIVKKFNWFTRAFESVLDKIIWTIIPLVVNVVLIIIILTRQNWIISLTILIWLILFLIVNWTFTKYKLSFDIQRTKAESETTGILADTITNHANVKLFTGYEKELGTFRSAIDKVRKLRLKTWDLDSIFDGIQGLLAIILEVGIFFLAIRLWQDHKISLGDFVLIQSYIMMIFYEIWNFGKVIRYLYSDLADAEEMTMLLTTPHEISDIPGATDLQVTKGRISFADVSFNYNETRKVVENFNLQISPGEKIALVGHSGAGKTTIIKLLLRMHDVSGGKIQIDGQDIRRVKLSSLWDNISLVPQDPILFHRSLMENIRYGKPSATDEEVISAAKLAHCHEFIMEFPEKYDTFVGERGVKLSGGERQRVAIARAILRNAPILILDEATSSLDSESESYIQDALSILIKNKTVVVIAHRLSTIMKMDRIVVMEKGNIIESGSHHELVGFNDGIYKQLWDLQIGGFMTEQPPTNPTEAKISEDIKKLTLVSDGEIDLKNQHAELNKAIPDSAPPNNPGLLI